MSIEKEYGFQEEICTLNAALAELKEENPIAHATQIAKIEFRIKEIEGELNE